MTVNTVALTVDGKRAVSASYDQALKVWDLESGVTLRTLVAVALHYNPGFPFVSFQRFSWIQIQKHCTQIPDYGSFAVHGPSVIYVQSSQSGI